MGQLRTRPQSSSSPAPEERTDWEAPPALQLAEPSRPVPPRPSLAERNEVKSGIGFCAVSGRLLRGAAVLGLCPPAHWRPLFSAGCAGALASPCEDEPSKRCDAMAAWWDMLFLTMSPFLHSTTSCRDTAKPCQGSAAGTCCCPTQPRRLNQARCSTLSRTHLAVQLPKIWGESSSLGSGHTGDIHSTSVLVPLIR